MARTRVLILACFCLSLSTSRFLAAAELQQDSPTEQSASEASSSTEPSPADTAAKNGRRLLKLLPSFKMLHGAPPLSIDLRELTKELDDFQADSPISATVLYNKKKKVAEATIVDGHLLLLDPGKVGKTDIVVELHDGHGLPVHSKFSVQVWEPDYWKLVLTVIGGLGLFLFGMKSISDGLQAVAGSKLRRMIALVTDNRFMAVGVGTVVTMIVQSSSITTVLVVGLVNSGFMSLTQAIGVIFGANIGTTITGWILVLKIGKYGLPIAGAAAFGYLFVNRDRLRYLFMGAMGLGLVFFGLELMKDGFAIIKDLPAFERWFETFTADSYFGVLKCAAVGCLLTFIVQSSSATLGITIGLAQIGVIPFETAAALVLGENIGTTITAWLASFGTTANAKRAAYAHVLFNILGVAWITAIFPWYMVVIRFAVGMMTGSSPGEALSVDVSEHVTAAIAATHTGFNVTNTLLFLPFANVMASLLMRLIPQRVPRERPHLTSLDVRLLESPVMALEQSRGEVQRMADSCDKMMACLDQVLRSEQPDRDLVRQATDEENAIDTMQDEIVKFMTRLLASNMPEDLIDEARRQLRVADEYESISDYIGRIIKYQVKLSDAGFTYDEHERKSLVQLHEKVDRFLKSITEAYADGKEMSEELLEQRGQDIAKEVRRLRREMIERMNEHPVAPRVSVTFNRQIIAYRRVRDHAVNVIEALVGEK